MRIALCLLTLTGCVTSIREVEDPKRAFDLPESDALLIEWRGCSEAQPCIHGDADGAKYLLGFRRSPATLAGKVGGAPVVLALDPESVAIYGNRVVEMVFVDDRKTTLLDLTWNEQEQTVIDAQLVRSPTQL